MNLTSALPAAVISVAAALLILWSNPARNVNRAVFACTLHLAAWLGCLHLAFTLQPGLPWLRLTCAVGTWLPLQFWMVMQAIVVPPGEFRRGWLRRNGAWVLICGALAALCFTDWFIPSYSTPEHRVYGWAYYGHIAANVALYGVLLRKTWSGTRTLSGVRRLELQVWLLGGCAAAIGIMTLMALGALTHDRVYVRLQPFVVLLFYFATAYGITTHRLLDARQLLLLAANRALLVGALSAVAYGLDRMLTAVLPHAVALPATTAVVLLLAGPLNGWLRRAMHLHPQAAAARLAAFEIARRESRIERMEAAFLALIKRWGRTERALILAGERGAFAGGGEQFAVDPAMIRALARLQWATPERLARERSTPERMALARFLEEHRLGVLAIVEGPTLTTLVGAGVPASRRPYTYPEVRNLVELAAIVAGALERAHVAMKAQRVERLATAGLMGAGLAHEIRNPLVTIKTFVQLLPDRYDDPVFREKFTGLIGAEVSRIDGLTEQLLELASPRAYCVEEFELHPVLQSGLELVAGKARERRIELRVDFQAAPDRVRADRAAVKQVLLNLCLNAIQAIDAERGDRWIKVGTRRVPHGIEIAVEDSGPGIAPEIRPHLFEPFRSTKSSGFGLGLAVCNDIVARLEATMSVDPAHAGRGATFRVVLPATSVAQTGSGTASAGQGAGAADREAVGDRAIRTTQP